MATSAGPAGPRPSSAIDLDVRCSISGLTRFAGIALRRAGHERLALQAFDIAAIEARELGEWVSAREERALTLWGSAAGGDGSELAARRIVRHTVSVLRRRGAEPGDMRGPLFGLLSMTVSLSRRHPHLLDLLPGLFRGLRRALAESRAAGHDELDIAIQEAMAGLYEGRARLRVVGRLGRWPVVRRWVLRPYISARRRLAHQPTRSLHARFDVTAGYAVGGPPD